MVFLTCLCVYHSLSLVYPIALLLKISIPIVRLVFTLQQPIFPALSPTIAQLLTIPTMVQTSIHTIISWKLPHLLYLSF